MTAPIVRFAPSPTGYLHLGNMRTALYNWLFAKKHGGDFILRLDDTDRERSKHEYADQIIADLNWLGIWPDKMARQSERLASYDAAVAQLKEAGLLYPAYDTPDELDRQRKRRRARGLPPVYDRRALAMTEAEQADLERQGRRPHWRFLLPNFVDNPMQPVRTERVWHDLFRGEQHVDLASMSDPILVREDGSFLYTLPSVVDDIDMGVTHVIRGDDHVTNTGAQLAVFEALGATPPAFGHHNLLQTEEGGGMSKRDAALAVMALKGEGLEPMAVDVFASLIGTSEPVQPYTKIAELEAVFEPGIVNKAAARLTMTELRLLNTKVLAVLPFEDVQERLAALGVGGGAEFWKAVRSNLKTLPEAKRWWRIVTEPIAPVTADEDQDFLKAAAGLLPEEPWDRDTWKLWTNAVKAETGRKGKSLFMPLRLALTGLSSGPELAALLPYLSRPMVLDRLS